MNVETMFQKAGGRNITGNITGKITGKHYTVPILSITRTNTHTHTPHTHTLPIKMT